MNHRKADSGIPSRLQFDEICQSSAKLFLQSRLARRVIFWQKIAALWRSVNNACRGMASMLHLVEKAQLVDKQTNAQ